MTTKNSLKVHHCNAVLKLIPCCLHINTPIKVDLGPSSENSNQIPLVIDARDLGVPLDTTFTASNHCREAANTARRLLSMVRRSFCELSKTAFIRLYCAIVRPHLEHAMEANAPTLRADINQPERVQRLATRLVRGLRNGSYKERLRQFSLFSLKRRRLQPFSSIRISSISISWRNARTQQATVANVTHSCSQENMHNK